MEAWSGMGWDGSLCRGVSQRPWIRAWMQILRMQIPECASLDCPLDFEDTYRGLWKFDDGLVYLEPQSRGLQR